MDFNSADIDSRLQFFAELHSYDSNLYLWTYEADGSLLYTNCQQLVLDKIFRKIGSFQYMLEHAAQSTAPLLMSDLSMMWGAVFEQEAQETSRIHVLGPVFTQTITNADLERMIRGSAVSLSWKPKFVRIMQELPVRTTTMFSNYILMMHYCMFGEHLEVSDLVMQREKGLASFAEDAEQGRYTDRTQIYMAEQSLLRMVRDGDLNYKDVIQRASRLFTGRHQFSGNALQNAKLGQVQFIAMCCTAAIEGGLSAESAYARKDAYIQDIENAKGIAEITEIGTRMYADYVTLVHKQRTNPAYSKAVQSSCDYIENHLDEKISIATLASRVGYAGYYLSRLFKKETGLSIDDYTRFVKIERAKLLLTSTQDSIQSISDSLGFSGRNYFAVVFRKVVGLPPAEYRRKFRCF